MKHFFSLFLVPFFLFVATSLFGAGTSISDRPNIVFILADDLGYGDLGCYGQQKIKTPVIDRLAKEGIRFTRHYSGNNVCAPSRAVLMTGLHPGHCPIRDNKEVKPEGQFPLPPRATTLIGELKKHGYVAGAFGKWGLGAPDSDSTPLKFGFDRFYGYNCQRQAHTYYPEYLWDNDRKVVVNERPIPAHAKLDGGKDPSNPQSYEQFKGENYSADLIAAELRKFVDQNAEKPFFVYWATTVPHLALQVPDDSLKEYQGLWEDPPYEGNRGYTPQLTPRAAYAAMVSRLDREVGRLVELLKEKGLLEKTLIVFTSDNGPPGERSGGTDCDFFNSNGSLRGRKGSMYEGGIRIPCVVSWKGQIKPESVSDNITGFEDWLPTLLELANGGTPSVSCDGISLLPLLRGEPEKSDRPFRHQLYREMTGYGAQQTVMVDDWKAVRVDMRAAKKAGKTIDDVKVELYDLKADPCETTDVAAKHPEKVTELLKLMKRDHVPSTDFPMPLLDD